MDGFIRVTGVADVAPGTMREFEVGDHRLLVANVDGEYFITDAHCAHLGGPLAKGVLEGNVVTCPWHGSQYDVRDGSCLRWTHWTGAVLSMAELTRHPRPIRAYETKIEDGILFVGPQKPPGGVPD